MSIFSKVQNHLKSFDKSRKAPDGLKFLGEANRSVYLINDESAIRPRLISNSAASRNDYPSFNGMVLKQADTSRQKKDNKSEFKTWNKLKKSRYYRKNLAQTFLCTSNGKYLVMERVNPVEGYDPKATEFADNIQDRVVKDLNIRRDDVDVHESAIGVKNRSYKIYDYPWIK